MFANTIAPTETYLNSLRGKHISEICQRGYKSDNDNHCAHFVSHVLGFHFGLTCGNMVHGTGDSVSLRVHEVFAQCDFTGEWGTLVNRYNFSLVFITKASNVDVDSCSMRNDPKKHVGIYLGSPDLIWHYSNSQRKVVSQSPGQFSKHYRPPYDAMFWGWMF